MHAEYHRLLLLFVDGVGLAPADSSNPFSLVATPSTKALLGGPLTLEQRCETKRLLLRGIDATLGVEGLPQSATGQAALFCGVNAAAAMGRHVTGLPGPQIRALVESSNLFRQAVARGWPVTFANAYSQPYLEALAAGRQRPSVTTAAVAAAGLRLRNLEDLERQRAVSWDIVRDRFSRQLRQPIRGVTATVAGAHLAAIAADHRLTVYETFITDMAGHRRMGFDPAATVARVDALLGGILAAMDRWTTVLLTSDHGNLEDLSHRRHTRNPVPLLAVGPLARRFAGIGSILEVTPRILASLEPTDPSDRLA